MRLSFLYLLAPPLLLTACTGEPADDDDTHTHDGTDDSGDEVSAPTCEPPGVSACDSEGAIIRGVVQLDPSLTDAPSSGELFVALTHYRLGAGETGGIYHIAGNFGQVDLATGTADFEIDMCAGGEMYSEENCEYNLIVFLDQNGNAGSNNFIPDPGEPTARIADLMVSCHTESPCLDVRLDCMDGQDCVSFSAEPVCACDPNTCNSDITTCL